MVKTDMVKAAYRAQQIADSFNVAFWVKDSLELFHLDNAETDLLELSDLMGFDIAKRMESENE